MALIRIALFLLIFVFPPGNVALAAGPLVFTFFAGPSFETPTLISGSVASNSTAEMTSRIALTAGAGLELRVFKALSLCTGIELFDRFFSVNSLGASGASNLSYHSWVAEAPLHLRHRTDTGIFLGGGIYASQATDEFIIDQGDGVRRPISYDEAGWKKFDYGVLASGGYSTKAHGGVTLEGRYWHGLANVSSNPNWAGGRYTRVTLLVSIHVGDTR